MRRRSLRASVALACTAALVLAACGGDDDNTASTGAPATTGGATGATTATTAGGSEATTGTAGGSEATTGTATEGSTAGSAAAGGGQYGLIDGKYKGPNDFNIDPADCPEDWDPHQGITDKEVKLFISLPKAGPFAGFGLLADGMQSYFKMLNEQGGIDGHQITLDVKDDGYQPDKTKSNVDEALGSNNYAALLAVLGTPNNLAIWDETNDECMPQLFNA